MELSQGKDTPLTFVGAKNFPVHTAPHSLDDGVKKKARKGGYFHEGKIFCSSIINQNIPPVGTIGKALGSVVALLLRLIGSCSSANVGESYKRIQLEKKLVSDYLR